MYLSPKSIQHPHIQQTSPRSSTKNSQLLQTFLKLNHHQNIRKLRLAMVTLLPNIGFPGWPWCFSCWRRWSWWPPASVNSWKRWWPWRCGMNGKGRRWRWSRRGEGEMEAKEVGEIYYSRMVVNDCYIYIYIHWFSIATPKISIFFFYVCEIL